MADIGYVRSVLKGIPDTTTRTVLLTVFEHLMGNMTVGAVDPNNKKATNFQWYHQPSTTATSTSEFSIVHGMDRTPQIAIPTLDLSQPGAKIVPLTVTKAADSRRIYLRSDSTNAVFSLLVE